MFGNPVYLIDDNWKDSGTFYIFTYKMYKEYGTLALDSFPWVTMHRTVQPCQDINTPEDLEIAKKKAGL
jgi:CMP-N-acetylneuraminic acid synthetase